MEKKMKYPYIGKGNESGTVVMMVKPECGLIIKSKTWATKDGKFETSIDETYITNITHEYLSNTWGVVESKEHAEFIVELAELHGFSVWGKGYIAKGVVTHFLIYKGELQLHSHDCSYVVKSCKLEQITIPLPPKDDKKELSEWPQVGDEVEFKPNPSIDKWVKASIEYVGDKFTILKSDNGSEFSKRNSKLITRKPKTPEEDLFDSFWRDVGLFMNQEKLNKEVFKSAFINNIKKKPQ